MLFGTFWWILVILIIITLVPKETSPEFVVHEIEACCHHRITLSCSGSGRSGGADGAGDSHRNMRIVVVQARYVIDSQEQIAAASPSSQPLHPSTTSSSSSSPYPRRDIISKNDHVDDHDPTLSSSQPDLDNQFPRPKNEKSISLWDLDIKFAHDLTNENLPHPIHVNAPPWHPSHISTYEGKQPFLTRYRNRFTTPPVFPAEDGFNFTDSRVIEMPPYRRNFLDKETIWREPLFKVGSSVNNIQGGSNIRPGTPRSFATTSIQEVDGFTNEEANEHLPSEAKAKSSGRESRSESGFYLNQGGGEECWSYQALSSTSASFTTDPSRVKPPWQFKDLRSYFNQRCSGRSSCTVDLLRGKQPDPDVMKLCHLLPEGKITVKYLCYNASSEIVHSRCNVDVTPANEGFIHNPGYPDLYPGDQPCQWRLHVPQQKILLVFFDISLRGREKSICNDELSVSNKLLSTCGDHSSAVAVLSETQSLNVTLSPKSRLAYPKRGFLIYYRVLGCRDPVIPAGSYMVFRNATHAYLLCDLGHLYPDTLERDRWLYCNPLEHTWAGTIAHCQDIRNYSHSVMGNLSIAQVLRNNPSWWPVRPGIKKDEVISDYILPICVMLALFSVNGLVLCFIWKQRQRLDSMENERNQEMEEICAAVIDDSNSPGNESSFSFPSSGVDEFAWHDPFDDDLDEIDQDRTLTTLTLHTTSSPPDNKNYYDSSRGAESRGTGTGTGNSYYRFSQDGSNSGIFSNSGNNGNGLISTTLYTSSYHQQIQPSAPIRPTDFGNGNGFRNHHHHPPPHNQNGGIGSGSGSANGEFMPNGHGTSFPITHHYFGYSTKTTDV